MFHAFQNNVSRGRYFVGFFQKNHYGYFTSNVTVCAFSLRLLSRTVS